jgi:hypothetical protein
MGGLYGSPKYRGTRRKCRSEGRKKPGVKLSFIEIVGESCESWLDPQWSSCAGVRCRGVEDVNT